MAATDATEGVALQEGLEKSHIRADAARRQLAVEANQLAGSGLHRIAAGIADHRGRHRGEPHLWKQTVDERAIGSGDAVVKNMRLFDRVPSVDGKVRLDLAA